MKANLAQLQAQLDRGDFATAERAELLVVRARLTALDYDDTARRSVTDECSRLGVSKHA